MRKILSVTVNTDNNDNSKVWKLSAENFGYPYIVLGEGQKWGGWKWRSALYLQCLRDHPEVEIFLLVDGNDLYFTGPASEFIEKFLDFNSPIVIGAERQCCTGKWNNPDVHEFAKKFCELRSPADSPYKYPNGGGLFGYRDALIKLLETTRDEPDDQAAYLEEMMLRPEVMKMDHQQAIIGNHAHGQVKDREGEDVWMRRPDGRVINTITQQTPAIMHFPGSKNKQYSDYERLLDTINGKNTRIQELESLITKAKFQDQHASSIWLIGLVGLTFALVLLGLFWYWKHHLKAA